MDSNFFLVLLSGIVLVFICLTLFLLIAMIVFGQPPDRHQWTGKMAAIAQVVHLGFAISLVLLLKLSYPSHIMIKLLQSDILLDSVVTTIQSALFYVGMAKLELVKRRWFQALAAGTWVLVKISFAIASFAKTEKYFIGCVVFDYPAIAYWYCRELPQTKQALSILFPLILRGAGEITAPAN
ncbi:uncharacterized protein Z518_05052 [Rhinocladiella mackenziei CBS 650.93]|uniref:Rhinocladiella mackenziei CBS 650.93 unplaced genomic scaffold supercont1.3, whole genome shotgun sequence n=1 Tax=Rhinocladiella mackenziei CBS 650.93 TaxID=1442369 RepID=A0A0D2JD52_9EURO|nr:uncharacterized protein Z518_05052 [Rhinocladiella mackenziei CBS 650.93]KIX07075.1 hypothetical protein Z518_05052 [Rhinocladiella mackenziei CBS 650.93]